MTITLSQDDFDRLTGILRQMPEFRTADRQVDFLDDVFAGSPRKADILGWLPLGGAPQAVAVRLITRLTQFGQDEPGRETLGVLVNKLLAYGGGGEDADFLRSLFDRYPLEGEPLATRPLDNWRGRESPEDVQEKIIGENTLRDVYLLELALEASRAVVRIMTATQLGSGFLAGAGLIMTAHHVIDSAETARDSLFTYNYQLDRQGQPLPMQITRALPGGRFYTNPDLDFTVLEIEETPAGVMPLALSRRRLSRNERVNIIQHPGGHYKKISLQNNFVAYADGRDIQYLTTTEPGSSGSPVLNNDFVVVGIHHSGGMLVEPGSLGRFLGRRYLRNAGSTMAAVLDDLGAQAPEILGHLNVQPT
jgi:S1-C subfamily serine protease